MTNTQLSTMKRGDRVVEITSGVVYTLTTDARMSRTNTRHEAYAVSPTGAMVVRVTHSSGFEEVGR